MARVPLTRQTESLHPVNQTNFSVRASPNQMGAAVGRGLQGLARGAADLGTLIEEISDQKARFEAKAALGQAQDQINGVLYDPDTGFMHSRGVNSVNGYDDTDKAIKKTVKDQGSSLSPQAKKYADEALKSLERNSSVQVGRHTAAQGRVAESQQSAAVVSSHGRMAVSAAADPDQHKRAILQGLLEIENGGFETGLPPEVVKEQQLAFESGIRKAAAISLAEGDPETGWQYLQTHKEALTPEDFSAARARVYKMAADHAVSMSRRNPGAVGDAIGFRPEGGASTVDDLADRIIGAESAWNPNAKNKKSSAEGLGQFIDSTWLQMVRQNRPDLLVGRTEGEVLALKTNATLSREMTKHYIRHNTKYLSDRGVPASSGNLYLAHFAGEGGAVSVLKAESGTLVSNILSADKIKANPFLKNMTAGDLIAWAHKKVGSGSVDRSGQDEAESVYDSLPPALWDRVESANNAAIGEARKQQVAAYDLVIATSPGSLSEQNILSNELIDDGDKARLIRSHRKANEDIAAAGRVNAAVLQGERLNPFSKEDRKGLDLAFKQSVQGVKELQDIQSTGERYISKTGMAPESYYNIIRGGLLSQSSREFGQSLGIASSAVGINPQAFAGQTGADRVLDDVGMYDEYIGLGYSEKEAAQKVHQARNPETQQQIKVLNEGFDEFAKVAADSYETWIGDLFDGGEEIGHTDGAKAAIIGEYSKLLRQAYIETNGQPEAAKAIAGARMKRTYGVSNIAKDGLFNDRTVLTKYPPERHYPLVDGSHEYLYEQAIEDVHQVTGKSFEQGDVFLRHGEKTAEDIRLGRPARYQVWYNQVVDGVTMLQVLPGFDFIGDVKSGEELTNERRIRARKAISDRNEILKLRKHRRKHPDPFPLGTITAPAIMEKQ